MFSDILVLTSSSALYLRDPGPQALQLALYYHLRTVNIIVLTQLLARNLPKSYEEIFPNFGKKIKYQHKLYSNASKNNLRTTRLLTADFYGFGAATKPPWAAMAKIIIFTLNV